MKFSFSIESMRLWLHKQHTPKTFGNEILEHLYSAIVSSIVILACTGVLLALYYQPSSVAEVDANGFVTLNTQASSTVIDADGDTLLVKDVPITVKYNVSTNQFNENDSLYKVHIQIPTVVPSQASNSLQQIAQKPFGSFLQNLHRGATHILAVICLAFCAVAVWIGWYKNRELQWWVVLKFFLLLLATAYTGYILDWNVRSAVSLRTVSYSLREYFPFFGSYLSQALLSTQTLTHTTLPRVFSLHTLVLPILLSLVGYIALRLRIAIQITPLLQQGITVLILLFASMIPASQHSPLSAFSPESSISEAVASGEKIQPEWYLMLPHKLIQLLDGETTSLILILVLFLWVAAPFIERRLRYPITFRITLLLTLFATVVSSFL